MRIFLMSSYEMKSFTITNDVYPGKLKVCIGSNAEFQKMIYSVHKDVLNAEGVEIPDSAGGMHVEIEDEEGVNWYYLWMPEYSKENMGDLLHECLHYTFAVLRHVGITLSPESEEAYTYFYQSTVERILHKIQ